MNKLEEYRDKIAEKFAKDNDDKVVFLDDPVKLGFDAAVALDLPVKFAKWKEQQKDPKDLPEIWHKETRVVDLGKPTFVNVGRIEYSNDSYTLLPDEKLYQYWVENILKLE